MIEKEPINISQGRVLINHGPTILVSVYEEKKPNIITLAWNMPVSHNPPLIAISVAPQRYSHDLIKKAGEFVVNIPPAKMLDKVIFCGTCSGKDTDKFKVAGLTPVKAQKVKSPLIEECIGHIECTIESTITAGDHTIFIGKIVAASSTRGLFNTYWKLEDETAHTLHHLGGDKFAVVTKLVRGKK